MSTNFIIPGIGKAEVTRHEYRFNQLINLEQIYSMQILLDVDTVRPRLT